MDMNKRTISRASLVAGSVAIALAAAGTISCGGSGGKGGGGNLDISVCDPSAGPFSTVGTNPYFPLTVGHEIVLDGQEDGEAIRQIITVLAETEVVAGVTTRVIEEFETVDGELEEISRNFVAEAPDGTVCYYGEDVDIYEDGAVVSHDGAWRAGVGGNQPGILMPANPQVGDRYMQEVAPGIAEDRAEITALGVETTVPAGTFSDTVVTFEDSALDPDSGEEKVYAAGVGVIVDNVLVATSID